MYESKSIVQERVKKNKRMLQCNKFPIEIRFKDYFA